MARRTPHPSHPSSNLSWPRLLTILSAETRAGAHRRNNVYYPILSWTTGAD